MLSQQPEHVNEHEYEQHCLMFNHSFLQIYLHELSYAHGDVYEHYFLPKCLLIFVHYHGVTFLSDNDQSCFSVFQSFLV